jgi:hypothetical protein
MSQLGIDVSFGCGFAPSGTFTTRLPSVFVIGVVIAFAS